MPNSYNEVIGDICNFLISEGYILRSGGAMGADRAFEEAYKVLGGDYEIYLPWDGMNDLYEDGERYFVVKEQEYFDIAKRYHPAWGKLKSGARKMMARNSQQMIGNNGIKSKFVICYTPDGKEIGGTAQMLRMANSDEYNTPIFNLGKYNGAYSSVILQQFLTFYQDIMLFNGFLK